MNKLLLDCCCLLRVFLFLALVFFVCQPIYADIVQYSDRSVFEAAAGNVMREDFESFSATDNAFRNTLFDFGDFSAFNGIDPHADRGDIDAPGQVNGSVDLRIGTQVDGALFEFTFDSAITAIGFDAFRWVDQRNSSVSFNNANLDSVSVTDPIDQTRFWGFISDTPFTTFTIQQTGGFLPTDGFSIDDVTFSQSTGVPEPTTFTIFGMGSLVLAAFRRRRRRQ